MSVQQASRSNKAKVRQMSVTILHYITLEIF